MKKSVFVAFLLSSSLFAQSDSFYEYVKVKSSKPIYETIYREIPNKECREVTYKIKINDDYDHRKRDDSLGIDSLVGTAAGVVVGSQIGKGNGRVAAQIVGGLLGAKVAHEIRNKDSYDDYNNKDHESYRYETRTECYNKPKRIKEKVLTGYKNYFTYKGIKYHKISDTPLKRVKITHTIEF